MNLYVRIRRYFKFLAERWLLLIIFTAVGLGIGVWVAEFACALPLYAC